ncbi:MAG: CoA transferase [Betaproteobacteria bacterium]|nr:CoA transferase [Betaproteobacteria bacterium]
MIDKAAGEEEGRRPLTGVRVIEVGLMHAGPIATGMLEALGAEVIKVEGVKSGDPARPMDKTYGQDGKLLEGRSAIFESYNSGKKSISLDLKHPEGRRLLHALVAKSDVFLQNMRAATAVSLGIDFNSLLVHNPKLVYASISGFGPSGPDATRPGLDPVGVARSGMMAALCGGSHMPPYLPPTAVADRMAGILASYGILAGLFARDQTSQPQQIESSLLGGAMWLGHMNLQYSLFKGEELFPAPSVETPLYTAYRCEDGCWIVIWIQNERAWSAFAQAIDMVPLATDPRFATAKVRNDNRRALADLLVKRFAEKTCPAWEQILARYPDLVFQPVRKPTEVGSDPQVLANGYVVEVNHPELGIVKRMALPLHVNGAPIGGFAKPAPRLGADSFDVLSTVLGLGDAEIRALEASGVTGGARGA